jgi:pyridinium-3,5-biscarboxylic acid mononucleotide sulfurtransferase
VDAREFADESYLSNPVNRCFFCKTNLYGCVARHTDAQILSGANLDDLGEYRPGLNAAKLHSVRHLYLEAGIDKKAVRSLARDLGLGTLSELPAAPCLSSRVETGIAIRPEVLKAIHAVEQSLAKKFPTRLIRCRVRAKGVVIELDPETLAAITGNREDKVRANTDRIFAGVASTLELSFQPYRNGSAFVHSRADARVQSRFRARSENRPGRGAVLREQDCRSDFGNRGRRASEDREHAAHQSRSIEV